MTVKEYKGFKIEGVAKGKADWHLFTDLCKGCGLCLVKCPMNIKGEDALKWSKTTGIYSTPVVEAIPEQCIGCGTCAMLCPDSAVKIVKK